MAPQLLENIDEYQSKIRVNLFFHKLFNKTTAQLGSISPFNIGFPISLYTSSCLRGHARSVCTKKRFVMRETRAVSLDKTEQIQTQ